MRGLEGAEGDGKHEIKRAEGAEGAAGAERDVGVRFVWA